MQIIKYNYEKYSPFDLKEFIESKGYQFEFKNFGSNVVLFCKSLGLTISMPEISFNQINTFVKFDRQYRDNIEAKRIYKKVKEHFGISDREAFNLKKSFKNGILQIKDKNLIIQSVNKYWLTNSYDFEKYSVFDLVNFLLKKNFKVKLEKRSNYCYINADELQCEILFPSKIAHSNDRIFSYNTILPVESKAYYNESIELLEQLRASFSFLTSKAEDVFNHFVDNDFDSLPIKDHEKIENLLNSISHNSDLILNKRFIPQ